MMHKPAALALLLALSGCGGLLRTDYQRPEVREPAAWTRASVSPPLARWPRAAPGGAISTIPN